jgi:tetratricopeptide (TPR) repeat protein
VARYSYASPQAREAFARARTLCNHFADYPELPLVVLGQGVTAWLGADYGAMLRHARELYDLAKRRDDAAACDAMADLLCGVASMLTGKLRQGRRYLERALAAERFVIPGTLMTSESGVRNSALAHLQNCLFLLGHAGPADATARRAILEWPSDPYSRAISQGVVCRTYLIERNFVKAAELVVELEQLATERGFLQYIGSAMVYRGRLLAETPRAAEGAALCRRGIEQLREVGAIAWLPYNFVLLAECHLRAGETGSTLKAIDEGHQAMQTGERLWEPELHRLKGQAQQHGEPAAAEACFVEALRTARARQARLLELRAATDLARLRVAQGRLAQAYGVLSPAYASIDHEPASHDLIDARTLLDACGPSLARPRRQRRQ